MNVRKETARVIVQEAHADYCPALKGNQKQAYEEIRNYFACKDLPENIRQKAGQYQSETEESELFATAVRRHWNIENNLHWTLDVVFREDSLCSKEKKAVHNLGRIRRFVMFIIKLMKTYYGRSMRRVRKTIGKKTETELPLILAVLRVLY